MPKAQTGDVGVVFKNTGWMNDGVLLGLGPRGQLVDDHSDWGTCNLTEAVPTPTAPPHEAG